MIWKLKTKHLKWVYTRRRRSMAMRVLLLPLSSLVLLCGHCHCRLYCLAAAVFSQKQQLPSQRTWPYFTLLCQCMCHTAYRQYCRIGRHRLFNSSPDILPTLDYKIGAKAALYARIRYVHISEFSCSISCSANFRAQIHFPVRTIQFIVWFAYVIR